MHGDHAKDQKKLAELLKEIKQYFHETLLGEEVMLEMEFLQLIQLLNNENEKKIKKYGGINQWNTLSDKEKLDADAEVMSNLVLQLGR